MKTFSMYDNTIKPQPCHDVDMTIPYPIKRVPRALYYIFKDIKSCFGVTELYKCTYVLDTLAAVRHWSYR